MLTNRIKSILMQRRYRWLLLGILLSFIGPLGEWLFLYILITDQSDTVLLTYFYTEILTLLCFSISGYYLGKNADTLEHIAYHDSLTGLFSRGYVLARFEELLIAQRRYELSFSIMLLDLDNFKKVNDQYGHLIGDKTLRAVAASIQHACRESDIIGRYGGEEILLICQDLPLKKAELLAERIRSSIASLSEPQLGYPGPQTVSIGLMNIPNDNDLPMNALINLVDDALYTAKDNGRNQISIATLSSSKNHTGPAEAQIETL